MPKVELLHRSARTHADGRIKSSAESAKFACLLVWLVSATIGINFCEESDMRFCVLTMALALNVGLGGSAWGQQSNQLLGIPFGSKLQLSKCPVNTDKATKPCWIGKPFVHKPTGSTLGSAYIPGSDARPSWAAYGSFKLTLDRSGNVENIEIRTFNGSKRNEIASSVSRRFGAPIENFTSNGAQMTKWKSTEGAAKMFCSEECTVEFSTPASQAEYESEMAARAKKDAARPDAP